MYGESYSIVQNRGLEETILCYPDMFDKTTTASSVMHDCIKIMAKDRYSVDIEKAFAVALSTFFLQTR